MTGFRMDRYLPDPPCEPGVHSLRFAGSSTRRFIAAVPSPDGNWWEGPLRYSGSDAAGDLSAELELREWLGSRGTEVSPELRQELHRVDL